MLGGGEAEGFGFKAELGEGRCESEIRYFSDAVGCESQVSGGGDFGIELFDGASAGVTGVHEEVVACSFTLLIYADELGEWDVDFASHFEDLRGLVGGEFEWERVDGSDGVGDIVALGAVASGECMDEDAFFVADGEGDAVDFGFADESDGLGLEKIGFRL